MNDYFAGGLARERQADYMREVEHDELVAQVHRGEPEAHVPKADRSRVTPQAHRRWRDLIEHLAPSRWAARSHRP